MARALVDGGRFVAGLEIEPTEPGDSGRGRPAGEPRGRATWWPLPAVGDREMLAGLVVEDSVEGHGAAATALAQAVDDEVRRRLATTRAPKASDARMAALAPAS